MQHPDSIVIFIDIAGRDSYSTCPIINGPFWSDAQSVTFNTIILKPPIKQVMEKRKINEYTINDFLPKLSFETWDISFSSDDVNIMFNALLDTCLKIFYCSFPLKKFKPLSKEWLDHHGNKDLLQT
jgi:glucose-6-phosphate 1-dehydrogenase